AVLLGAGGAARGAAFGLAEAGIERLIILNRHLERAQRLATDLQQNYDEPVFNLSDPAFLVPHSSSIIINATSLGMHGRQSTIGRGTGTLRSRHLCVRHDLQSYPDLSPVPGQCNGTPNSKRTLNALTPGSARLPTVDKPTGPTGCDARSTNG
ncbi:MAG TPA: hypothetical protein VKX46_16600, partial [Ktedonobacteraceae bacterium]|nr:hypothetical protein [Ktedonobacteraceae bacterium]